MRKFCFDVDEYHLAKGIEGWFGVGPGALDKLHRSLASDFPLLTLESDQSTHFHKTFYEHFPGSAFERSYLRFIWDHLPGLMHEDFLYQRIPTFRVQVPGNLSVGAWHKDTTYGHRSHERNVFLPLTAARQDYTIWAESEEARGDFAPMEAEYGEYWWWTGPTSPTGTS